MSTDKSEMFIYYWKLLARDIPVIPPEAEYYFDKEIGRRHRFDFAWPDHRIAVEVDGGQCVAAGGRHAKDPDRDKLNIAASMRWLWPGTSSVSNPRRLRLPKVAPAGSSPSCNKPARVHTRMTLKIRPVSVSESIRGDHEKFIGSKGV